MADKAGATERLFEPFLDPVDMVGCFPATATLGEINEAASAHGLRFPLVCDPSKTLAAHLSATEFAPASARFGPYADNVLGMNWQLPGGALTRLGEQVVKTSTGYDLQRFLLHSGDRFGRATAHVLRLRPIGGAVAAGRFSGNDEALDRLSRELRISPWNHWIDRTDLLIGREGTSLIEVSVDCLPGEEAVFCTYFEELGSRAGAAFQPSGDPAPVPLPDFCVKACFADGIRLAREVAAQSGGEARLLLLNAYLMVQAGNGLPESFVSQLAGEACERGGHVFGLSRQAERPGGPGQEWLQKLETEWGRP